MTRTEQIVTFDVEGSAVFGVLHRAATGVSRPKARKWPVLIVVGGPQYRVGSHRQFVQVARALGNQGFDVLRFDFRGMGDSEGELRSFEECGPDVAAAIDFLFDELPDSGGVFVWGLCDGASAVSMFASKDRRVKGMVLLNPWVRSKEGLARSYFGNYYKQRFGNLDAWRQLLVNPSKVLKAFTGITRNAVLAARGKVSRYLGSHGFRNESQYSFIQQMERGLRDYSGSILIILSGQDITANEFVSLVDASSGWQKIVSGSNVTRKNIPESDHTFSKSKWQDAAISVTVEWLEEQCDAS